MTHHANEPSPRAAVPVLLVAALVTLELADPGAAHAGIDRWTDAGPAGGLVTQLLADPADPARVYAAGPGLFVSRDGGRVWDRLWGGVPEPTPIGGLAIDPGSAPATLWAIRGSDEDTLYRSTDGGATWTRLPAQPAGTLCALAVLPTQPATVLVASPQELFRSLDGGATWAPVLVLGAQTCGSYLGQPRFALDPRDPTVAYYSWERSLVIEAAATDDAGATWSLLPELPDESGYRPGIVAVSPSTPEALYAYSGYTRQLWRSQDRGQTWQLLGILGSPDLPASACADLVVDPSDPIRLLAGCGPAVLISGDGGVTWEAWQAPPAASGQFILAFAHGPAGFYAAAVRDVFRSADGVVWEPSSTWIRAREGVPTLAPSNPDTVYLTVDDTAEPNRLYRTRDAGATWERLGYAFPDATLVIDPGSPGTLYSASYTTGLRRSRDGGVSWNRIFGGDAVYGFDVDPADPTRLYAADETGLYRSVDDGTTWERIFDGADQVVVDPGDPAIVFAVWMHDLFVSHDGGSSWEDLGLFAPGLGVIVAIIPGADGAEPTLFARVSAPPYLLFRRSVDGGRTWHDLHVPGGPELREDVYAVPSDPPVLYGLTPDAVLRSDDLGDHWQPVPGWRSSSFPGAAIHPRHPERVFLSTPIGLQRATFAGAPPLALGGGRFEVRAAWFDAAGRVHPARPVPVTPEGGAFWFFRPDNLELVVKLLDAGTVNGYRWAFSGALSHLGHEITFVDTETGLDATLAHPGGQPASGADLRAIPVLPIPQGGGPLADEVPTGLLADAVPRGPLAHDPAERFLAEPRATGPISAPAPGSTPGCSDWDFGLCLLDRFDVRVFWWEADGGEFGARAIPVTSEAGVFRFAGPDNLEVAVKVLDGRAVNGHFWVFWSGMTGRAFSVTIVDAVANLVRSFDSPAGAPVSFVDLAAFE